MTRSRYLALGLRLVSQQSNMFKLIANFMILFLCTIIVVSLPLWRSEKVQKRSKRRVARGWPEKAPE
jgi:hypothetical protein